MSDLISRQAVEDLLDEYMSRLRIHIGTPNDTESYSYARGLLVGVINDIKQLPSAQPDVVRCKDCKWLDKYSEKRGYCMATKHGFMSSHWEIGIYRIYDEDFFCADAEPKEKEGGDNEKAD